MTFGPIVILTTRRVMFFIIVLYIFSQPLYANREKKQQNKRGVLQWREKL